MAERIRINHESLENRIQQLEYWKIPRSVKLELLRFLDDLALGKVNRGNKISAERQLKYLNGLHRPLEFFNKPTGRLTIRDIERFEKALGSGQLGTNKTGRVYAHNTQVEMRRLLKIFLRWCLGTERAAALTNWLDTRYRPKTPDYLSEAEIENLYLHCRTAQQRFLIAVLFDTGARAEEFHNIRYEDICLPEGKDNFVKVALKEEYSKTLGRTIALYWKHAAEAVQEYLSERIAAGIKPTDPVFSGNYSATRKYLQRLGASVLNRPVHYHLFRHSSSTYYATKLNRQELCYRYGWKFSSDMPDIYISRAGMESKALDEKFTQTELSALKSELVQLEQAGKIKDERMRQLEETMRNFQHDVARALKLKPSQSEIEAALKRKMH